MSALLMADTRDTRSAIVRVVSVTLRSIPTPRETSTTPRYIVTISGSSIANSTAETPRRSRTKEARNRKGSGRKTDDLKTGDLMAHHSATGGTVGFIAERRRGHQ